MLVLQHTSILVDDDNLTDDDETMRTRAAEALAGSTCAQRSSSTAILSDDVRCNAVPL